MSTKAGFQKSEIRANQIGFPKSEKTITNARTIIETTFYGNNVIKVNSLAEAYELAKNSPGTIVTDMPVDQAQQLGLPSEAKVLVNNDGAITGRYAASRKVASIPGTECEAIDKMLMDAVYDVRSQRLYHAQVCIGLDPEFMVRAHLLVPQGEENILYNWMVNFQYFSEEYLEKYNDSPLVGEGQEPDIYIFANPQWSGTTRTDICDGKTLCYFHPESNCAAILGMRYFGEYKKGTLTLAWAIAERNGYISSHAGEKLFHLDNGNTYVATVVGLSGSGKSTIIHDRHNGKYKELTIVHDDALIINTKTGASLALEPNYFDNLEDYPSDSEWNRYLITCQNCGATIDDQGNVVVVSGDIRNGNGRAIKSRIWSTNRVNKMDRPINAVFWLMRDTSLPPVLKVNGAVASSVMGATLATKRTVAERLKAGVDPDAMVFEPYANPFRTYPLSRDYEKFKNLFEKNSTECYILNTGDFCGRNITKEETIGIVESIVDGKYNFIKWGPFPEFSCVDDTPESNEAIFSNPTYTENLKNHLMKRLQFAEELNDKNQGFDKLPEEAVQALRNMADRI